MNPTITVTHEVTPEGYNYAKIDYAANLEPGEQIRWAYIFRKRDQDEAVGLAGMQADPNDVLNSPVPLSSLGYLPTPFGTAKDYGNDGGLNYPKTGLPDGFWQYKIQYVDANGNTHTTDFAGIQIGGGGSTLTAASKTTGKGKGKNK
jgi:hypothetical protein